MKFPFLFLAILTSAGAWATDLTPLKEVTLSDGRIIVAGPEGRSVYTFDVDQGVESKCYDSCAEAWPPVVIESNQSVAEPLGTTARKDGALQITVNGKPVYYFANDEKAGDIFGENLGGVWHLILQ